MHSTTRQIREQESAPGCARVILVLVRAISPGGTRHAVQDKVKTNDGALEARLPLPTAPGLAKTLLSPAATTGLSRRSDLPS